VRIERQEQDWNELATLDPYWAILSAPGKRYGRWDEGEFFASGTVSAAEVVDQMERLGHPCQRRRALDFGCGLGRMTRAFAQYFDECVGVDISENMVRGAKGHNADMSGAWFVVNRASNLGQFSDSSFDFVYSAIALQHVPDRGTIESYIREFFRVLRPDGLVAFQLPSHIPAIFRLQWRRRLYSGLRRVGFAAEFLYERLHLVPIAMSYIPEPAIVRLVESAGARVLHVETQSASGLMNAGVKSTTYYATR
jgi:ubiquinone/menaquinone biosynthesis C-methylase UbiE